MVMEKPGCDPRARRVAHGEGPTQQGWPDGGMGRETRVGRCRWGRGQEASRAWTGGRAISEPQRPGQGPTLVPSRGAATVPRPDEGRKPLERRAASPAPKGRNLWSRDLNPGPLAVSPLLVSVGDCPLPGRSLASQVPHGRLWVPGVPGSPKLGRVGGD